jgi:Meiotic cell cortex C-terminal pleckstrin homology
MEEETAFSLPSPTDTPYRTPSSSRSRRSHTLGSMSPSSSPPPLPFEEKPARRGSRDSVDPATDESISPLDPRRFTPTLHASLVSEILSLRRDLEDKNKNIEHLETDLHSTQEHNEALSERIAAANKESWSLKRQMQHLEGGTLSAINEIAKERDKAQSDLADVRKRLELSQKKARSQEENAERTQALWDRDRQAWDAERRVLETKVHVVEGRIKVVLDEVARMQSNKHVHHDETGSEEKSVHPDSPSKYRTGGLEHRSASAASDRSDARGYRFSNPAFMNGHSTSLADELALGEEEPDIMDDIHEHNRYSLDALPEEHDRPMSAQSRRSQKAYRVLGLPLDFDEGEIPDFQDAPRPLEIMPPFTEESSEPSEPSPRYVDSGVQYSPPPSPGLPSQYNARSYSEPFPSIFSEAETARPPPKSPLRAKGLNFVLGDNAATQATREPLSETAPPVMVSSSAQTTEVLPSFRDTSANTDSNELSTAKTFAEPTDMKSSSTQTDITGDITPANFRRPDQFLSHPIPTIAIIPPSSRPATPTTDVVLPPRTKNASSQVGSSDLGGYVSSGMQTEEIRVDQRPIEIPPHLLPLASRAHSTGSGKAPANAPPTALPNSSRRRYRQPPSAHQLPTTSTRELRDAMRERAPYPPENDGGPLAADDELPLNRPIRSSSLFAGFDEPSDDELDRMLEESLDEDDFFRRPPMKFTLKSGRLISHDPVVEEESETYAAEAGEAAAMEQLRLSEDSLLPNVPRELMGRQSPPKRAAAMHNTDSNYRQLRRVPSSKQTNYRRAVLISSGTAAHSSIQPKALDALIADIDPPPFPVPTRFSSRKVQKSASEGGRSTTPTSGTSPTKRRRGKANRIDLRKARSATSISASHQLQQERSRSPLLNQRKSIVPDLPSLPPLPIHDSYGSKGRQGVNGAKPPPVSGRHQSHSKAESVASSVEQTSVVDAIAQTMVGEWMYKYVRRRKSFGMPESKPTAWDPSRNAEEISANVTSTGVRHKRWVWVAPYERAIMWSSKQPISGTALLGKSGRKRKFEHISIFLSTANRTHEQ